MSLNCNEINLILEELSLKDSFIQEIVQPGFDTIAFYTYKEGIAKTVLVCTAQNECRICQTNRKIPKNDKPLRFMEFLRSKIKGCKILNVSQLGFERIIKFELTRTVPAEEKSKDSTNHIRLGSTSFNTSKSAYSLSENVEMEEKVENYNLYVRLWNNASNIFLCDENNQILEVMFRRPKKNEIKDCVFELPEIKALSDDELQNQKEKFPVREIPEDFTEQFKKENKSSSSPFNSFIDLWYSEHSKTLSHEALLEKAEKWYSVNKSRRENALNNLLAKQKEFENCENLKHHGDLILTYGHLLKKDTNILECEDYDSGKQVRLIVDPALSAQENAQIYYKNYKKALSGKEDLEHDIEIAKKQLQALEKQYSEIKNEANPIKIEQLLRKDSTPLQQKKKTHPGLEYLDKGWLIYVGRDANENDDLLRHNVRGDDLWLHVRDFPGGYVFIKAQKGKTVPLDILLDAANLACYYSKARQNTKIDLYYTHVKYLRRAKNGPKGLVLPTQEKNLCVSLDKERLSRLDLILKEHSL